MKTAAELRQQWLDIVLFDIRKDPKVAAAQAGVDALSPALTAARDALDTAQRARKDREQRTNAAQAVYNIVYAQYSAAKAIVDEAEAPLNEAHKRAIRDLHIDTLRAFLGRDELNFVNAYGTGQFKVAKYDTRKYEVYTYRIEAEPAEFCAGIDHDSIRINFRNFYGDAGDLRFELAALDPKKTLEGGVPDTEFGYTASVEFERQYRRDSKYFARPHWGSYSGMNTVEDARLSLKVMTLATDLGAFMEQVFGSEDPKPEKRR